MKELLQGLTYKTQPSEVVRVLYFFQPQKQRKLFPYSRQDRAQTPVFNFPPLPGSPQAADAGGQRRVWGLRAGSSQGEAGQRPLVALAGPQARCREDGGGRAALGAAGGGAGQRHRQPPTATRPPQGAAAAGTAPVGLRGKRLRTTAGLGGGG